MASLNKVMLIGHLGKDPEIISFENGTKKMSVTLATTERYRDRNGEWAEQTDWHNLVAWGNLALDIAEINTQNGYVGNEDALWNTLILSGVISMFACAIPMFFYTVTEKKQREMVAEIEARKGKKEYK